jgi:hypothetical protein
VLALALVLVVPSSTRAASLTSRYASVANYHGKDRGATSFGRRASAQRLATSSTLLASMRTRSRRQQPLLEADDRIEGKRGQLESSKSFYAVADDSDDLFASATPTSALGSRRVTYNDLSPIGKVVAGTVEVCIATVMEYLTGFTAGYVLGSVTDVPRLLFRPVEASSKGSMWQEVSGRTARMNSKSLKWAKR